MAQENYPFSTPGYLKYRIQVEEKKTWDTRRKYYLVYKQYDNGTEDLFEIDKGQLGVYLSDHYDDATESQIDDMFDALYTCDETLALMITGGYCTEMEVCYGE